MKVPAHLNNLALLIFSTYSADFLCEICDSRYSLTRPDLAPKASDPYTIPFLNSVSG